MSSDLAAFLTARLDEDEAAAKAAEREIATWSGLRPSYAKLGFDVGDLAQTFGPARVLREVEVKRTILAGAGSENDCAHEPGPMSPRSVVAICGGCNAQWPCETVRLLAAVYSDHPGYRAEWAL